MQKHQNKDTTEEKREIFLLLRYVYVVSTCYVINMKYFGNKIHYARFNEDDNEFYTIFYTKFFTKLVSHVKKIMSNNMKGYFSHVFNLHHTNINVIHQFL